MRDTIGANFTTKQVKFGFRKVSLEFEKRLDPQLPFYYHTSTHTRFSEGPISLQQSLSGKAKEYLGASCHTHLLLDGLLSQSMEVSLLVHGFIINRLSYHHPQLAL